MNDEYTSDQENVHISQDKNLLQLDRICEMLQRSYWAQNRGRAAVERSIKNSTCFGVYFGGEQIGFARVITDFATTYYLCDVVIEESWRGRGIGKMLVSFVVNDPNLKSLFGILATRDAHGLYEQFGFTKGGERFMFR